MYDHNRSKAGNDLGVNGAKGGYRFAKDVEPSSLKNCLAAGGGSPPNQATSTRPKDSNSRMAMVTVASQEGGAIALSERACR